MIAHRIPPAIRPLPLSSRSARLAELEEIRTQLPIHLYLQILHTAALTGQIPDLAYDPATAKRGELPRWTGQSTALRPEDRMKLLQYLVDKALSPLAATKTEPTAERPNLGALPPEMRNMTIDQLLATIQAAGASPVASISVSVGTESADSEPELP